MTGHPPLASDRRADGASTSPTLSVVIPHHNQTAYLVSAVESALAQSSPPLEIIVVDDGSTDDRRDVSLRIDPRVRHISQERQGLGAARNTGICAARGDLIGFLDADDEWLPGFTTAAVSTFAERPDASAFYCRAQAVDADGNDLPQVLGGPAAEPDALYQTLLRANFLIPSTVVIRADVVRKAGLFDTTVNQGCEDWDLWLRLTPRHRFVGSDACLVRYRLHGASLSSKPEVMQRAALDVIGKRFGRDDGLPQGWPDDKRRAYGGVYRYLLLTTIQHRDDWTAGALHLGRALRCDPSLARDLDLFYQLGLGSQPAGYRGTRHKLALEENTRRVERLLAEVLGEQTADRPSPLHAELYTTADRALGLLAYNTQHYSLSRRLLLRALSRQPAPWRDALVVGNLLKSYVRPILPAWRTCDAQPDLGRRPGCRRPL